MGILRYRVTSDSGVGIGKSSWMILKLDARTKDRREIPRLREPTRSQEVNAEEKIGSLRSE
jgi:hypothetical protein